MVQSRTAKVMVVTAIGMAVGVLGSVSLVWTASSAALSASTANSPNDFGGTTLNLVDDDSAAALFDIANLVPADTVENCIEVDYTGSNYQVTPVKLYATLDSNTDNFADHLDLVIEEGTGGSFDNCTSFTATSTEFTGTLTALTTTHTNFSNGTSGYTPTAASTSRVYRVTATLGTDTPNTAQGDSASATFTWEIQTALIDTDLPPNPSWWLDASADDTLFTNAACTTAAAPGDDVRCWKDRASANQVTGTDPATYATTTLNGLNPITFPNAGTLTGPDLFGGSTDDIEIFFVSREIAATPSYLLSLNGTVLGSTNRFSFHPPYSDGYSYFDGGYLPTNRVGTTTRLVPVGQAALYNGYKDAAAGHNYLTVSNSATTYQSTSNSAGTTTGGILLGVIAPSHKTNHDLAEVIIYDRSLTPTERAEVTAYLMTKWGITAIS